MDVPIVPTGGFRSSTVEERIDQIGAAASSASSTCIYSLTELHERDGTLCV